MSYFREHIAALEGYEPGEQPTDLSVLKLNTNENPYPPSPHVLPTGGTARFWSGVSALGFLRRTSVIEYTPQGLARDADDIDTLARAEYLDAHARSATLRKGD